MKSNYSKNNHCIDCNKLISNTAIRCIFCARKGKLHWNYIDGRKSKKTKCIVCGKEISIKNKTKKCKYCSGYVKKLHYCIDCGKEVDRHCKRCKECDKKWRREAYKGKNNPAYLDAHTLKKSYCIICGKKITWQCFYYGSKMCRVCSHKSRWEDKNNRNKWLIASFLGRKVIPNNPEKILIILLNEITSNDYQFVGDGRIWITNFNPDFINTNGQKKIIELYGDYWHNRPEAKKRNKLRIRTYKKYGYSTLIVWQHELKDLENVASRIMEFDLKE